MCLIWCLVPPIVLNGIGQEAINTPFINTLLCPYPMQHKQQQLVSYTFPFVCRVLIDTLCRDGVDQISHQCTQNSPLTGSLIAAVN